MKNQNIKSKICDEIIQSGLVKKYDVVEHSYTDGGGERFINTYCKSKWYFSDTHNTTRLFRSGS